MHGEHVIEYLPEIEFLLELPVGYKFIFDVNTGYLDVWKDG